MYHIIIWMSLHVIEEELCSVSLRGPFLSLSQYNWSLFQWRFSKLYLTILFKQALNYLNLCTSIFIKTLEIYNILSTNATFYSQIF